MDGKNNNPKKYQREVSSISGIRSLETQNNPNNDTKNKLGDTKDKINETKDKITDSKDNINNDSHLRPNRNESGIKSIDKEANKNNESYVRPRSDISQGPQRPNTPSFEGTEFYDEYGCITKNFINPRLFVISNDNTGIELLNEEQIFHFKQLKDKVK